VDAATFWITRPSTTWPSRPDHGSNALSATCPTCCRERGGFVTRCWRARACAATRSASGRASRGSKILDYSASLGLSDDRWPQRRAVLREYGNMSSATILFVLDQSTAAANPPPATMACSGLWPPSADGERCGGVGKNFQPPCPAFAAAHLPQRWLPDGPLRAATAAGARAGRALRPLPQRGRPSRAAGLCPVRHRSPRQANPKASASTSTALTDYTARSRFTSTSPALHAAPSPSSPRATAWAASSARFYLLDHQSELSGISRPGPQSAAAIAPYPCSFWPPLLSNPRSRAWVSGVLTAPARYLSPSKI